MTTFIPRKLSTDFSTGRGFAAQRSEFAKSARNGPRGHPTAMMRFLILSRWWKGLSSGFHPNQVVNHLVCDSPVLLLYLVVNQARDRDKVAG